MYEAPKGPPPNLSKGAGLFDKDGKPLLPRFDPVLTGENLALSLAADYRPGRSSRHGRTSSRKLTSQRARQSSAGR